MDLRTKEELDTLGKGGELNTQWKNYFHCDENNMEIERNIRQSHMKLAVLSVIYSTLSS
ncbi:MULTISPECIES: hypothetical protein [unclassified Ensifer]|uniref:hypothetical protein n=1 Tax=unclassified Ensifer TaxID=2633371 RepID=UPI00137472E0|nr:MULTISPECIES: hypothetical protein [unclassified Ensifer]